MSNYAIVIFSFFNLLQGLFSLNNYVNYWGPVHQPNGSNNTKKGSDSLVQQPGQRIRGTTKKAQNPFYHNRSA